MLSGQAGDVIPGPPLTSENSFELQIQAQRKHLPVSYLTCNGQHAFCLMGGPLSPDTQNHPVSQCHMWRWVLSYLQRTEEVRYLNKASLLFISVRNLGGV